MKTSLREFILGRAKDPTNPRTFHTIALAAFFAWVGLGADGLSSSCYGPEEAFLALQSHPILALPLAALIMFTVTVLSAGYSQLIEAFPSGGGGYVVSTKLLGRYPGLVCGWALVLDYILTIAVSLSSGVDALFSFLPLAFSQYKLHATVAVLILLIIINLRGVKESVLVLLPIFLVFLLTHVAAILVAVIGHAGGIPDLFASAPAQTIESARAEGGWLPLIALFLAAYSLGGGTFTGIEAVSNSMQILREPRVATGKRTMVYMAASLSFVAGGIILGYLLFDVRPQEGKTLNAVLLEGIFGGFRPGGIPAGGIIVIASLLSAGALLFVGAQAGFIGGPRTLATMALDRWVPARFGYLSNRLVIGDGVLFMGGAALLFILITGAQVKVLLILYSINVFVTFTLSQLGMCRHWWKARPAEPLWRRKLGVNATGLLLSASLLAMMVGFKFTKGGWLTLFITGIGIGISLLVRRHYERIRRSLAGLDILVQVPPVPAGGPPPERTQRGATGVILVSGFNGLGMHSFYTLLRMFPGHFENFVFISVGVVDYEEFKGVEEVEALRRRTVDGLERYVSLARTMGFYAEHRSAIGTDLAGEIEGLAGKLVEEYPGAIFFAGQLVFEDENAFTRSLHSQAAFEIQRRLRFSGVPVVLIPVRISGRGKEIPPAIQGPGLPADRKTATPC